MLCRCKHNVFAVPFPGLGVHIGSMRFALGAGRAARRRPTVRVKGAGRHFRTDVAGTLGWPSGPPAWYNKAVDVPAAPGPGREGSGARVPIVGGTTWTPAPGAMRGNRSGFDWKGRFDAYS